MLDAIVVARERTGAKQVDRAVRADEPRARRGRLRCRDERRDERGKAREERSHTDLLSRVPGNAGMTTAARPGSQAAVLGWKEPCRLLHG